MPISIPPDVIISPRMVSDSISVLSGNNNVVMNKDEAIAIARQICAIEGPEGRDYIMRYSVPVVLNTLIQTASPTSVDTSETTKLCALWALTNIASLDAETTAAAITAGVMDAFMASLVSSECCPEIKSQSLWGIGNILGEKNIVYTRTILEGGFLTHCLSLLKTADANTSDTVIIAVAKNFVWCLSNITLISEICDRYMEQLAPLFKLALHINAPDAITDVLWAISRVVDSRGRTEAVAESNCILLFEYGIDLSMAGCFYEEINNRSMSSITAALDFVCNVSCLSNSGIIYHLIKVGIPKLLCRAITEFPTRTKIVKNGYFALSNLWATPATDSFSAANMTAFTDYMKDIYNMIVSSHTNIAVVAERARAFSNLLNALDEKGIVNIFKTTFATAFKSLIELLVDPSFDINGIGFREQIDDMVRVLIEGSIDAIRKITKNDENSDLLNKFETETFSNLPTMIARLRHHPSITILTDLAERLIAVTLEKNLLSLYNEFSDLQLFL